MIIRVGTDGRRSILDALRKLNAPALVSANTLWNDRRKQFVKWRQFIGTDVALDSGGFIAMKRYGGYRWTTAEYVQLAADMRPTWWAQMDYCCEPQVAGSKSEVRRRITMTAAHLCECEILAASRGIPDPLPVLQGWEPKDYTEGPIYDPNYKWPALVGIGSVCRRSLHGPNGILAVLKALDQKVPRHVKFHLFGVKGVVLSRLVKEFPHRAFSVDSMAWNMEVRWRSWKHKVPADKHLKVEVVTQWYLNNKARAFAV